MVIYLIRDVPILNTSTRSSFWCLSIKLKYECMLNSSYLLRSQFYVKHILLVTYNTFK